MKNFLTWDSLNNRFKEENVSWTDIDLTSFNIHDILIHRKPNTVLAIDENNTFTYLPFNDTKQNYTNILGELSLLNVSANQIVDVTHYKDIFGLRQVNIFTVQYSTTTVDILSNYTIVTGSYQNPIILDPNSFIEFYIDINTLEKHSFNFSIDNTSVTVKVTFMYPDSSSLFTIDSNGNTYVVSQYNEGIDLATFNTYFDTIKTGYDTIRVYFHIHNPTTTQQTISSFTYTYTEDTLQQVNTADYKVNNISSSLTRITFNKDINNPVLIRINAPLFKDTKDISINPRSSVSLSYPIDLTNAIIAIYELLSSNTVSEKSLRIEFNDPDKYIYDPSICTIDGAAKFKTLYYNNIPYTTDKPVTIVSTGYYDLHFLEKLLSIQVLYDDKNPYIDCKISLTFDDGVNWVGWDGTQFITFTNLNDIQLHGIPIEELNNIPLDTLTNQYGKIFNIAVYFKNNNKTNEINSDLNVSQFTSTSQNVTYNSTEKYLEHKVDIPATYGNLIEVYNPNDYPVYNYPIYIDLSSLTTLPLTFKIYDTENDSRVYYFFADEKFSYYQTHRNTIVMIVPYLEPKQTKTFKIVTSLNPGDTHPKYTMHYYVHGSMGEIWRKSSFSTDATAQIINNEFVFEVINVNSWFYPPNLEDLMGRELHLHWRKNDSGAEFFYNHQFRLRTEDGRYIYVTHSTTSEYLRTPFLGQLFTVDPATRTHEYLIFKFKDPDRVEIISDDYAGNTFTVTQDLTTFGYNTVVGHYSRIEMYLNSLVNSNIRVGATVTCMYSKPYIDQDLQVTVKNVPYPQPEQVEVTLTNPINVEIPHVNEYYMKLNCNENYEAAFLGFQVSPDGNIWYYYDTNTSTFVQVNNNSLTIQATDIKTEIPIHTYKSQFGNVMYIKIYATSYNFKIYPYVTFTKLPKDTSFLIDDIIINYQVSAHYIISDVNMSIQNSNTLVLVNNSNKQKQVKVNIVG